MNQFKVNPYHERALHAYIIAKDEQRPHLLRDLITPESVYETCVPPDEKFFQNAVYEGREAFLGIVSSIGQRAQNIYTVCTLESVKERPGKLECKWLIAEEMRENGAVFIGWGGYIWSFEEKGSRVTRLVSTMDAYVFCPGERLNEILGWASALSRPWCETRQLLDAAPVHPKIERMQAYFR